MNIWVVRAAHDLNSGLCSCLVQLNTLEEKMRISQKREQAEGLPVPSQIRLHASMRLTVSAAVAQLTCKSTPKLWWVCS